MKRWPGLSRGPSVLTRVLRGGRGRRGTQKGGCMSTCPRRWLRGCGTGPGGVGAPAEAGLARRGVPLWASRGRAPDAWIASSDHQGCGATGVSCVGHEVRRDFTAAPRRAPSPRGFLPRRPPSRGGGREMVGVGWPGCLPAEALSAAAPAASRPHTSLLGGLCSRTPAPTPGRNPPVFCFWGPGSCSAAFRPDGRPR